METEKHITSLKIKSRLNKRYRLVSVVQEGACCHVFKARYRNRFFRSKSCIIKAAAPLSPGCNIRSRLQWQAHVHKSYAAQEYLPKCIDHFDKGGTAYLVLEFVKGMPLSGYLRKVNPRGQSWYELDAAAKQCLLHVLQQIITVLDRFHKRGYIHRGLSTDSIFIGRRRQVYFINAGMAWSPLLQRAHPPFPGGRPWYGAPEQNGLQPPTDKEDIYALGALMATLFSGLCPSKFRGCHNSLDNDLYFLTGSRLLGALIQACLHPDPAQRPGLPAVAAAVAEYEREMEISGYTIYSFHCTNEYATDLQTVLSRAAQCLVQYTVREGQMNSHAPGLLYLLAMLQHNGIAVTQSIPFYYRMLAVVKAQHPDHLQQLPPGLDKGAAAVAQALSAGMLAGLIPDTDEYRRYLLQCLELPAEHCDMNKGAAGQGIALGLCRYYMEENTFAALLQRKAAFIVMLQQKKGCWQEHAGFAGGSTGITRFLLEYLQCFKDARAERAALKALRWTERHSSGLQQLLNVTGDAVAGTLITFIKAYEVLKINRYKIMVEAVLDKYPKMPVHNNYTQNGGLAALGEVYLEAYRVFRKTEWKLRANWIGNLFLHAHCHAAAGREYWVTETGPVSPAHLIAGNGGILYFLLRCLQPQLPPLLSASLFNLHRNP